MRQPPWKFKVGRKDHVLAEFEVPAHKMGTREVATLLRAIMVRYRTETPEEMVGYYVNGRRGSPARLPFADVSRAWSDDQEEQGYLWKLGLLRHCHGNDRSGGRPAYASNYGGKSENPPV